MRAAVLAICLALSGSAFLAFAGGRDVEAVEDRPEPPWEHPGQHLAVIVPVYRGDLSRAVSSLERWPSTCSSLTERSADLVLYYAEGEEDAPAVTTAVETIRGTAGRCFAETRLVYAHLSEEEDVYPKGPSVMFFKMFLDEGVHADLSEYDALAIVEWDVLVASDHSFEELHHAAFRGNEDFWVKGSNLGGTNFHSTAQASELWNVLGHINGNAIYNNNDPDFVEYVDYTRTRWGYTYPYDVALWLTISDFPYSWPLWQRYSRKFVTTNLISYVGYEHVDHGTVSDAVAGHTLFIHGSRVDEGSLASLKATKDERKQTIASRRHLSDDTAKPPPACNAACGSEDAAVLPVGTSTVCDDTCAGESPRFGGFGCGAGHSDTFGSMCRLCFVDVEEARRHEQSLALTRSDLEEGQEASHVIMCDTMRPPEAAECSSKCGRKKDTVCDESCGSGRHGDYNCNWRNHGPKCRFCFNDLETALMADKVAQRRGGRVIMCSTFEPPQTNVLKSDVQHIESWTEEVKPEVVQVKSLARTSPSRKLQANFCDAVECPHTNSNGFRGRVCDPTCADGIPYGTNGCGARGGRYGDSCRVCYIDVDRAVANDDPDNRAIMCDTVMPVVTPESSCDEEDCPHTNNNGFRGRVCDPNCEDGVPYGTNGCGAREGRFGALCRVCYNDVGRALANDDPDNRAIMCNTVMPVDESSADFCDEEECPRINNDGLRGRVCDPSCADGVPYGTNGCGARQGRFGNLCRVCYFDQDRALANDATDDRAIMCDTLQPVTIYVTGPTSRRLARSVENAQPMFAEATVLPYVNDLVRGNLCAFIAGDANEVDQVEVAVTSVLRFFPGMTVAVASDYTGFHAYQRAVGVLPGVTVHATEDPVTASLYADEYCSADTSLIFYMKSGSVLSRQFTFKDTHSTHGDLLVVYGNAKLSYVDRELAKQTTAVLGFQSPSFTFNTDLVLPVGANADLREVLVSGENLQEQRHGDVRGILKGLLKIREMLSVPQLMAALAYSKNTPGVWFLDPEAWVSQHLFRTTHIWEIPLVKPRYTCSIDPLALKSDANMDVALILQSNLDFFTHGGKCDTGYIDIGLEH